MQPILGVLFEAFIVIAFVNMLSFGPIFMSERSAIPRERARGLYSTLSWYSALLDVETLFVAIQVRCSRVYAAVVERRCAYPHCAPSGHAHVSCVVLQQRVDRNILRVRNHATLKEG